LGAWIPVVLALVTMARPAVSDSLYDTYFTDEALRVDLIYTGTVGAGVYGIDEVVVEPIWPGTRVHLIDPTQNGKYRFRVFDQATGVEIFSRGYCTLMGEWLLTDEAKRGVYRSMPESVRFPFPKAPVSVVLESRDEKTGAFARVQKLDIDSRAYRFSREKVYDFDVIDLSNGDRDPSRTVDVVIVPDGYTHREAEKMQADAQRFADAILGHAPFDDYADRIAVRLVRAFSRESGVDEPRKGIFRDTVVGTTFDTFGSPRYLTTSQMKRLRQVAALAPYDTVLIMVNTNRYGGGGIYGAFSIFPSDNDYDEYILIHEFGHGLAGLADEYYTSPTGYDDDFYREGVEPWEPNVTCETAPDRIKWRSHITPGVPIPTPDEAAYDDVVGLFEGAGYRATGLYRPTRDSRMLSKGLEPFGPVNRAAIERMIHYYTEPGAP
jgi:hypothetical protein